MTNKRTIPSTCTSQIDHLRKISKKYPCKELTNSWVKTPSLLKKSKKAVKKLLLSLAEKDYRVHRTVDRHLATDSIPYDLIEYLTSPRINTYKFPALTHNLNKNDRLENFLDLQFIHSLHTSLVDAYSIELKLLENLHGSLKSQIETLRDLKRLISHYRRLVDGYEKSYHLLVGAGVQPIKHKTRSTYINTLPKHHSHIRQAFNRIESTNFKIQNSINLSKILENF